MATSSFFYGTFTTNLAMYSPYRIVWHEPPGNQVRSYRLNLMKVPMILAIIAWAEDRVPIPSMGFDIGDKLVNAMHIPLVRLG